MGRPQSCKAGRLFIINNDKFNKVRKRFARLFKEADKVIDKKTGHPKCPHCGTLFKRTVAEEYREEWAINCDCCGKERGLRICFG